MIKMLSCFSGIGAFEKALVNLGIKYDLVGFSEIDKYAVKSYCAIHGVSESINLGDITKINAKALPKDIDLFTYGFPCQDISLCGKQKGLFNEDGSQTRSGLFFEALRIIEETQPKVAIAENVKNLVSKKFNAQFQVVLASLEEAGYNNYWAVLNLKDFGIPQNRERVFIVSVRKDVDTGKFEFPKPFPLEKRLKDVLEETVDSEYYIEEPYNEYPDHTCRTIKNQYYKNSNANFFLKTARGATGVVIRVREATKQGYAEAHAGDSINLQYPNSTTRRGRVGKQVAQTLTTSPEQAVVEPINAMPDGKSLRIRKLTPKECFRLMGFDDADFEKAEAVNSNTQLYKQAGNSIGVPVLEHIYKALLECGAIGDT